jgi:transposase-like protein
MCLENILIICDIIESIWDKNNINEISNINDLVSKGSKSVSWMKNNESVMRFYNNGSEKTWRFRFIQQFGIQLEKQISLIKGII